MQKHLMSQVITVRRSPLSPLRGILRAGPLSLPCALGRSGTTIFKREGDGATPAASMPLLSAFRRPGRMTRLAPRLPVLWTRPTDGWCDAPRHAAYNRHVRLPFPASAETLQRRDRLYDFGVVLDFNLTRRQRGGGSAIFLHVARAGLGPTQGCVALLPADMERLAPVLSRRSRLRVLR